MKVDALFLRLTDIMCNSMDPMTSGNMYVCFAFVECDLATVRDKSVEKHWVLCYNSEGSCVGQVSNSPPPHSMFLDLRISQKPLSNNIGWGEEPWGCYFSATCGRLWQIYVFNIIIWLNSWSLLLMPRVRKVIECGFWLF